MAPAAPSHGIPCPSIFERKRPLKYNTMRRIARGVRRYVIEAKEPFIVTLTHHGSDRIEPINEPLRTTTGAHRGEKALVVPTLIQTGYGERKGQAPRVPGLEKPMGTVMGSGNKHALVAAFLAQHNTGMVGRPLVDPVSTITESGSHQQLVTSHLIKFKGTCKDGQPVTKPMPTVQAQGLHTDEVRAFLLKYYGTDQNPLLTEPLGTLTAKHRFGLITVHGEEWYIADIGMRMLTAPELYRAQGFPRGYVISFDFNGKPLTKTAQVKMCGNSVSPPNACAVVHAQFFQLEQRAAI
jgi:DNA (cytosine-5)-methyltransferase 1